MKQNPSKCSGSKNNRFKRTDFKNNRFKKQQISKTDKKTDFNNNRFPKTTDILKKYLTAIIKGKRKQQI